MGRYIVGIDAGFRVKIEHNRTRIGMSPTARPVNMQTPEEIDRRRTVVIEAIEKIFAVHGGSLNPVTSLDLSVETSEDGIAAIRGLEYVRSVNPSRDNIRPSGLAMRFG